MGKHQRLFKTKYSPVLRSLAKHLRNTATVPQPLGQRLKAVHNARVSVGKHLSLDGISASSHVWDIQ